MAETDSSSWNNTPSRHQAGITEYQIRDLNLTTAHEIIHLVLFIKMHDIFVN